MSGNVNNTSIVLLTNKPKLNTLSFECQKTRDYFLGKPISGQDIAALKSKDSGAPNCALFNFSYSKLFSIEIQKLISC
jgi:hypothetical protein